MSNCAKVSLVGRIIKEPTQKVWKETAVVSFTMAVNTTKKEGEGNFLSDFYNVSVWGKSAEFILPKIKKGSLVVVHGDLILQPYTDKNGVERQSLSVRASDVLPLTPSGSKKEEPKDDEPSPEQPF